MFLVFGGPDRELNPSLPFQLQTLDHYRFHWLDHLWLILGLFINGLETDSAVFFLHGSFVLKYADLSNQRDFFFFTVHSFYVYDRPNQSNTRDRKKSSQQQQSFFFNPLLFLSARLFLVYKMKSLWLDWASNICVRCASDQHLIESGPN